MKQLLVTLFGVVSLCVSAQGQILNIDSLFQALSYEVSFETQSDMVCGPICDGIFNLDPNSNYIDSTLIVVDKLIEEAKNQNDLVRTTQLHYAHGRLTYLKQDYAASLEDFKMSQMGCFQLNDSSGVAENYTMLASINYIFNKIETTMRYQFEVLKINEELGNDEGVKDALFMMGYYLMDSEYSPVKSIDYLKRSVSSQEYPVEYCCISEEFLRMRKPDSALHYLGLASEVLNSPFQHQPPYYYRAKAKYHHYKFELDSALVNFEKAITGFLKVRQEMNAVCCFRALGEIAMQKRHYDVCEEKFTSAVDWSKRYNKYNELAKIYMSMSKLYTIINKPSQSLRAVSMYEEAQDSMNALRVADIFTASELQYEFTERENQLEQEKLIEEYEKDSALKQKRNTQWIAGLIILSLTVILFVFLIQRNRISKEQKKSEELLLNILPEETAEELKRYGVSEAKQYDNVSVLFTDFKDFTKHSERMSAKELVDELNVCFKAFDAIVTAYDIEKIKTVGDAYIAAAGLPVEDPNHAQNMIRAAISIRDFMKARFIETGGKTFRIRCGIHSGMVVAGIVGMKKYAYDIWGDTVNTAARMEQNSEPDKINISDSTYRLVKDSFKITPRGKIEAKNKGELEMYYVEES